MPPSVWTLSSYTRRGKQKLPLGGGRQLGKGNNKKGKGEGEKKITYEE